MFFPVERSITVSAPHKRRPAHLLDLFLDRRRDRGVADVRVDLHEEVTSDDHRLGFGMIDVRWNDRATPCDFIADEFRRDEFGIDAPNDWPGCW
jgi:hypothetical protein